MPYFDANATAPLAAEARQAWLKAQESAWHNPSSPHRAGARVAVVLEAARERLAALLRCQARELVFCSGATEANNALMAHAAQKKGTVLISAVEHPSVREAAYGFFGRERVNELPVEPTGVVVLEALDAALKGGGVALCSVMAANNETGVLQPWREIAQQCRAQGVPYHCDAAQWVGKEEAHGLGICDGLTLSAHKFGGPKGVGVLKVPEAFQGIRMAWGGGQQRGWRGGTEDYPGVAAMLATLEAREAAMAGRERLEMARANFEKALKETLPEVRIVSDGAARLWNTVNVCLPRHANTRWVAALDRRGFEVSTGSACATGKAGGSPVLGVMGLTLAEQQRVVRVSACWETTQEDWEALACAFAEVARELDASAGLGTVIAL